MNPSALPFRHAVVTGACGGLGQALARELLAAGAHVTLVGLNRDALQTLADLAPGRTAIHTVDVGSFAGGGGILR